MYRVSSLGFLWFGFYVCSSNEILSRTGSKHSGRSTRRSEPPLVIAALIGGMPMVRVGNLRR